MSENNIDTTNMSVGEILRHARTTGRRKREIATVSKQLCIREEFLEALEQGNYNVIPETVYILGFARNYAMELGLNPDEIVNKLKKEMGLISDCQDEESSDDGHSCSVNVDDNGEKRKKFSFCLNNKFCNFVRKKWLWFVGGLALLIAIIIALVAFIPGNNDSVDAGTESVLTTAVVEPEYKQAVRERFGTENSENAEIILQASQESWVKIEDNRGNTVFSRVLVPGDVYYVPAGDDYKATFGNAGGVDIWVNGQLAPKQGDNYVRKSGILMSADTLMPASDAQQSAE